ncbi:MAG: thiamine phosphate synthase [Spirochaetales bacterium]|nr:thiamine phosphate synthase [Spirochaetales bacterium]
MDDFGLYFIVTKPHLPYRVLAEACVARGVKFLQLREKDFSDRDTLKAAEEIREVTEGTDTKLIINDRADLSRLVDADGLHLGQGDLTLEQSLLFFPGKEKVRGLSTHSPEQARRAWQEKPDYIGFGPIFPTPTKKIPDPAVGTEQLGLIVAQSPVPVVAIGGLFPENLEEVISAGARNVCLVRHFMECQREEELIKRIEGIQKMLEAAK